MSDLEKSIVRFNEMYKTLKKEDKDLISSNLYKKNRKIYRDIVLYDTYPEKRIGE